MQQEHIYFGVDKNHKILLLKNINKSSILKSIGKFGNARFLKTCYPYHKIFFIWRDGTLLIRNVLKIKHEEIYKINEERGTPVAYLAVNENEMDDYYITTCFENGRVAKLSLSYYNFKRNLSIKKILPYRKTNDMIVVSSIIEKGTDERDYMLVTRYGRVLRPKNYVICPRKCRIIKSATIIADLDKGDKVIGFFKVPREEDQTEEDSICAVYDIGKTRRAKLNQFLPVRARLQTGALLAEAPYRHQGSLVGACYVEQESDIIVLERSDKKLYYMRAGTVPIVKQHALGSTFAKKPKEDVTIVGMNNLFVKG